jgi:ornithine decarboxylase
MLEDSGANGDAAAFDCASRREIEEVIEAGSSASNIIYAQPCKKLEDIRFAEEAGVRMTVVDSVEEVEKLRAASWTGSVLVRLLVGDTGSKQPFGKKFGAPVEWLDAIYHEARLAKQHMVGFSFHVGSECYSPRQYYDAIGLCRKSSNVAEAHGFPTEVIDIGGGFLPAEKDFVGVAAAIREGAASYFGDRPATRWIAEPGRFMAAPTYTLHVPVIGRKPVWPPPQSETDPRWRYTIDESVYGMFSNIPFDHQVPEFQTDRRGALRRAIVFGRTCDSADLISETIELPEDLDVGDVLTVPNMGAYTVVSASEFNGFPKPQQIAIE